MEKRVGLELQMAECIESVSGEPAGDRREERLNVLVLSEVGTCIVDE